MKKVYISGRITGIENKAKIQFAQAEAELQAKGFHTVNPFNLNHNHDKSWQSYMRECIRALCDCTTIYMLPGWKKSRGANLEFLIANMLHMEVLYAEHIPPVKRGRLASVLSVFED